MKSNSAKTPLLPDGERKLGPKRVIDYSIEFHLVLKRSNPAVAFPPDPRSTMSTYSNWNHP
jgi:hypothetical protein